MSSWRTVKVDVNLRRVPGNRLARSSAELLIGRTHNISQSNVRLRISVVILVPQSGSDKDSSLLGGTFFHKKCRRMPQSVSLRSNRHFPEIFRPQIEPGDRVIPLTEIGKLSIDKSVATEPRNGHPGRTVDRLEQHEFLSLHIT